MTVLTHSISFAPFVRLIDSIADHMPLLARVVRRLPVQPSATTVHEAEEFVLSIVNKHESAATVLRVEGTLNHDTYEDLIEVAAALYQNGIQRLALDLASCQKIGLSGLFALHSILVLYRGETPQPPESGLRGLCEMATQNQAAGMRAGVQCINVHPQVAEMLFKNGFRLSSVSA